MASDCKGRPVKVGTKVRLLKVAEWLRRDLPPDEWRDLNTMVGKVFEVTKIDEYGSAWVEKWWHHADGGSHSHSLALASHEMETVEGSGKARGSAANHKPERKDHMTKAPTEFLNVDIDLRSVADPTPFIDALGRKVLSQRIGKDGRAHWVRLMLAGQPAGPGDAILQFAKFVAELPPTIRAIWENAVSKEFDIGIQAGFEPSSAEWVLDRKVVEAAARVGARVRITVYSANFDLGSSEGPSKKKPTNKRRKGKMERTSSMR